MAESEEELKSLLMKVKEESGLELNIQKNKDYGIWSHHFMANRWENNGNSDRLYFLGSKITADGDCSHEIKRHLLLGRKAMTNVDSILKSRDVILLTKICLVKAVVFPKSCMDVRVHLVQFSHSLVSDSVTPWAAVCQASLSITNSWNLLELREMDHQES